jgi:hypothetical protein
VVVCATSQRICSRKPIIPHWVVVCATSQPLQVHNRENKSSMSAWTMNKSGKWRIQSVVVLHRWKII